MRGSLELLARREGERVKLSSPGVGDFTCAVPRGRALAEGQGAGVLLALGRAWELTVPKGVAGVVLNPAPEQVHAPVGFGTLLYELGAIEGAGARSAGIAEASLGAGGALVFRSPSTGRFWHRAAPGEPPLVRAGDVIEPGRALGLIEVMKTFALVGYVAGGGLPARARVVRVLAADGAEVAENAPLLELEPA